MAKSSLVVQLQEFDDLPEQNPLVHFRVRSVNAKFESAGGIRSAWVDPRCENLIADFNVCAWNKDGTDLQKWGERGGSKYWLRTHLSDGFGYMIHRLFPLGREVSETSPLDALPKFGGSVIRRFDPSI